MNSESKKKEKSLTRLLGYAGTKKGLLYASWILAAVSAFVALVPYYYIWKVIGEVIEVYPEFERASHITQNGIMALVFAVIAVLIYISALMCSHLAAFRVATNIRLETIDHIARLPLGAVEKFGSGKMRKIINDSSAATETYLAHQLPDRYVAMATPVGLLILLLVFDWRLGLLSLIPVVLGFLIMMSMTGKEMQRKMKEYQDALDDMSNEAVEYIRGIPVVKTFGQTIYSFKRFKGSIDRYQKWVIAYTKQLRLPMMFYTTAINGVFAILIAGAIVFTKNGVTDTFLLNLIFYIIITPIISLTLTKIMFQSEQIMIVEDALSRIDSILDEPLLENRSTQKEPEDYSIELKNVSFSYDGKQDVIRNVSLKIGQGKMAAFVGPSGGGKTTLASLISRFFDVKSGQILIGGTDVRDIEKKDLMNLVSFVFQNSRLIKASILDNVRMGKPDASREEVMEALKNAQCMDIIEKLPDGVDTVIGTKGTYLSGGEQQRITIARTMLKDTPIVILDEATAFADPDNEVKVQAALSSLSKNKTVIMIAHRLTTVLHVDEIFVLKEGSVTEHGSSRELMERNGLFAEMMKEYQSSVNWKVEKGA